MVAGRAPAVLAATLVAAFAAVWVWQTGGLRGPMAGREIDAALARIEDNLPMHPENGVLLERLRAWCEADDGGPVFMLNLMRFHPALRPDVPLPGFDGGPQEANAFYEERVVPLVLGAGGHPVFTASAAGANLVGHAPALDAWSRVALVRYPSRRHFLALLADPAYGPLEPYKRAAVLTLLVPLSEGLLVPEPRVLVGALALALFLGGGWWRAARSGSA